MPFVFVYLIKLSISLAIVFLFYQFVLRRLTFYTWNRCYLIGYTVLSFFIPFIDITPVLQENAWSQSEVVQWVPLIVSSPITGNENSSGGAGLTAWDMMSVLIVAGIIVFTCRLLIQLLAFRKMRKTAVLVHGNGVRLYQVEGN